MTHKRFITYEEQLKKLAGEKQLIILDTDFAMHTLQQLGYLYR